MRKFPLVDKLFVVIIKNLDIQIIFFRPTGSLQSDVDILSRRKDKSGFGKSTIISIELCLRPIIVYNRIATICVDVSIIIFCCFIYFSYFSEEIDLSGLQVDMALRKFQSYFRMPVSMIFIYIVNIEGHSEIKNVMTNCKILELQSHHHYSKTYIFLIKKVKLKMVEYDIYCP